MNAVLDNPSAVCVASAAYPVDFLVEWRHYENKLTGWVEEAVGQGARLLVFPEYASMELISLSPDYAELTLSQQLERLQSHVDDYVALHQRLAIQHKVYILAGSIPVAVEQTYRNRAYFFAPDGAVDYQEKIQMTRFENESWGVSAGDRLKVFHTDFGKVAINICYDSEFPLLARQQVEAGANIILVPSCTDTLAGYNRVRIGSQARALENQCFVVQSPLVGNADWSEAVDVNVGAAAIYGPVDRGFPDNGIIAQGVMNEPGWTYQTLNVEALEYVRKTGQVFNHRDWRGQMKAKIILLDCADECLTALR